MKRHADLKATLRLLFEQRYPLLGGALVAALTVLAGMALLGLSGWFITATAIAGWQTSTALMFDVFGPSAGIRLLALGRTGARYSERLITHDATFAALVKIRVRLFHGWALPDAANRLLRQPSKLLFRLTADIDALEAVYLRLLVPVCTALCAALAAGVTLGFLHSVLGLTVALWLLISGYGVNWWLARSARHPNLVRARSLEKLRSSVIDLVAGHTDLVMAGRMAAQRAQLAHTDYQLVQADRRLNRLETSAAAVHTIISSSTLAAVLLASAALVEAQTVTVPLAVLALLVSLTALEPFAGLRRGALEAGRALLAMKRLGAHLGAASVATQPTAPDNSGLRMSSVSVAPAGHHVAVLHAVTLHLAAGEKVALIGPSGAGKSTLLALAAGELAPLSGTLQAPRASLFTQRTELFKDSLRDNLRLADPGADDLRLWAALEAAGLADEVRALTAGLDTELGEGGLGLSGGQARRLALARLFLQQASLWLLDEATEALNSTVARDVLQRLAARASGRTVLIATHLRREAELADRLIIIRHGGIVGDVRRGTAAFDAAMATLRVD